MDQSPIDRLAALAAYAPAFASTDFEFGTWRRARRSSDGAIIVGSFVLSDAAYEFVSMLYDAGWIFTGFDWVRWKDESEACSLRDDPSLLAQATETQLGQLLTIVVKQERFIDGSLDAAFKSGLLTGITQRAERLVDAHAVPLANDHQESAN